MSILEVIKGDARSLGDGSYENNGDSNGQRMEHENGIRMTKGFQCQGPPGTLN